MSSKGNRRTALIGGLFVLLFGANFLLFSYMSDYDRRQDMAFQWAHQVSSKTASLQRELFTAMSSTSFDFHRVYQEVEECERHIQVFSDDFPEYTDLRDILLKRFKDIKADIQLFGEHLTASRNSRSLLPLYASQLRLRGALSEVQALRIDGFVAEAIRFPNEIKPQDAMALLKYEVPNNSATSKLFELAENLLESHQAALLRLRKIEKAIATLPMGQVRTVISYHEEDRRNDIYAKAFLLVLSIGLMILIVFYNLVRIYLEQKYRLIKLNQVSGLLQKAESLVGLGSWSFDPAKKKFQVSEQMARLFARTPGQGVMSRDELLDKVHVEDKREFEAKMDLVFKDCQPEAMIFRFKVEGEYRWFDGRGYPKVGRDGRLSEVTGTIQDVTERMQLQVELEKEQNRANHAARLISIGEMAAEVMHEINNPLMVLSSYVRQLKQAQVDDEKRVALAEGVGKGVRRIERIIVSLKRMAYCGDGGELAILSLEEVLNEAMSMCEVRVKAAGITLKIRGAKEAHVWCRQVELAQVFVNLINNAHDGIKGTKDPWIRIEAEAGPDIIEVRVTDSGHGIPKDIADHLFESFYTTKNRDQGTGLGLSLCRRIVESLNGSLEYNDASVNTQFVLRLPVAESSLSSGTHVSSKQQGTA